MPTIRPVRQLKSGSCKSDSWREAILELERQILQEAQALLAGNPTSYQLADFERQAAARVPARLKEIR